MNVTQDHPSKSEEEIFSTLCSAIQRQSATCMDLVRYAVELEREQCAMLAEREAHSQAARGNHVGAQVVAAIAEQIRARAGETANVRTNWLQKAQMA